MTITLRVNNDNEGIYYDFKDKVFSTLPTNLNYTMNCILPLLHAAIKNTLVTMPNGDIVVDMNFGKVKIN